MARASKAVETEEAGEATPGAEAGGSHVETEVSGTGRGGAQTPLIELDFVKGLIEAVDASGIDSLEITRAGTRVKIAKTPPAPAVAPSYLAASPAASPPPPPAPASPAPAPAASPESPAGTESSAGEEASGSGAPDGQLEITSPMVGTFYRAPAPEAPPYVEVGTRVSKGQTLCILEAMKLMNELESEVDGVIREILVDNADPVEYGQVLFRVDPNG